MPAPRPPPTAAAAPRTAAGHRGLARAHRQHCRRAAAPSHTVTARGGRVDVTPDCVSYIFIMPLWLYAIEPR